MEIPNYEKMEGWKSFDYNFEKNEVVGFVAPTYFWGIPKNVKEFLEKISIKGKMDPIQWTLEKKCLSV